MLSNISNLFFSSINFSFSELTIDSGALFIYPSLDNLYNQFVEKTKDKYQEELEWIYIEHLLHAASLRFLQFDKYEEVEKITKIIKNKFPKWNKNKYYKTRSVKYKTVCTLIYSKQFKLLKLILK